MDNIMCDDILTSIINILSTSLTSREGFTTPDCKKARNLIELCAHIVQLRIAADRVVAYIDDVFEAQKLRDIPTISSDYIVQQKLYNTVITRQRELYDMIKCTPCVIEEKYINFIRVLGNTEIRELDALLSRCNVYCKEMIPFLYKLQDVMSKLAEFWDYEAKYISHTCKLHYPITPRSLRSNNANDLYDMCNRQLFNFVIREVNS